MSRSRRRWPPDAARRFVPSSSAGDIAFLQYTGGTTGVSKGATLTHGNVLANVQQNTHWVEVAYAARGKPDQITYMCALPLYHIFALTVNAICGMDQGGHNVLIPNPRDIPAFVKEMAKYDWNFFAGLNTLFNALVNNEEFRKLDFSHVKLVMGGGMAVQKPVADRWKEVTGSIIYEGYGLSETSPVATANRFDSRVHRHDRPAAAVNRHRDPRRGRQRHAARRGGRDLHPRAAGDGRLLEPAGRDRQGDDRRRLFPFRRHGLHGREPDAPRSSTARRT
jgi:acyl-CoA synthetase (AMP-forming)/AMP-acid ligase II